ncbi:MAG TPA: tetratricopeptide repeat protein, partial [Terriglobales bacterium]|nr:tetratricopeptide repeat protein [Terriglobales bacterium]
GSIQYKREKYADAETALKQSLDADPGNPDAVIILRLALALDQQKKYPEALEQAKRAVELSKEDTAVGKMAREERDRLLAQTSGGTPSNPAPASTQQTPAPPPQ